MGVPPDTNVPSARPITLAPEPFLPYVLYRQFTMDWRRRSQGGVKLPTGGKGVLPQARERRA